MAKTDRKEYRLKRGRYNRRMGGEVALLRPGDRFFPTGVEVARLGDQIEPTGRLHSEVVEAAESPKKPSRKVARVSAPAKSPKTADAAPKEAENPAPAPAAKGEKAGKLLVTEALQGGWFVLSDGRKIHGKKALEKVLKEEGDG